MTVIWHSDESITHLSPRTRWYLSTICWMFSHDEPIWSIRAKGPGWTCPTCGRFRVSSVLKELAGHGVASWRGQG